MILGTVDRHRTPVVPLVLRGAAGEEIEIEAVVDTGFNGSLTLPAETIAGLGCAWRGRSSVTLANGSRRSVLAESAETEPLIGTRLLNGCRLWMHIIRGGEVQIETSSEGNP